MENQQETRTRPKPVDFDQLYPGRFIKAGELLGKKVTLTITDVDMEDLIQEDGKKKAKATIAFKETEKQLVMCKTNGISIKAMFGKVLAEWIGKRVTIFPDTWNNEPCVRIWGSPDIAKDQEVEISLPRRRPFKKTMHAMVKSSSKSQQNGAPAGAATLPDVQKSIADLRATHTTAEFETLRKSIWGVYAAAGKELPLELEGAANDHAEALSGQDEEVKL